MSVSPAPSGPVRMRCRLARQPSQNYQATAQAFPALAAAIAS